MVSNDNVLGLIAAGGRLPFIVAAGAKKAGLKVICVGLVENAEPALANEVDKFYRVAIARPGSWIRKLKKHDISALPVVDSEKKILGIVTSERISRLLGE